MIDLPPEVNSARIVSGPGAAPLMAAAGAWQTVAGELNSAAAQWRSTIMGIPWTGPSAQAMSTVAAAHLVWLVRAAVHAEQASALATRAVSAYETARAAMVPLATVMANRVQLVTLLAANVFGQNTPAIAAAEAVYGEMWAQDSAAMVTYQANSASAVSELRSLLNTYVQQFLAEITQIGTLGNNGAAALGLNANLWNTIASTGLIEPIQYLSIPLGLGSLALAQQSLQNDRDQFAEEDHDRHHPPRRPPIVSTGRPGGHTVGYRVGRLSVPEQWVAAVPQRVQLASAMAPSSIGLPVFMPMAMGGRRGRGEERPRETSNAPTVAVRTVG